MWNIIIKDIKENYLLVIAFSIVFFIGSSADQIFKNFFEPFSQFKMIIGYILLMISIITLILVLVILPNRILSNEQSNNTWNLLMSLPISKFKLWISKLLLQLILCTMIFIIILILNLIMPNIEFDIYKFETLIVLFTISLFIILISTSLSYYIKNTIINFIIPMCLGLLMFFVHEMFLSRYFDNFFGTYQISTIFIVLGYLLFSIIFLFSLGLKFSVPKLIKIIISSISLYIVLFLIFILLNVGYLISDNKTISIYANQNLYHAFENDFSINSIENDLKDLMKENDHQLNSKTKKKIGISILEIDNYNNSKNLLKIYEKTFLEKVKNHFPSGMIVDILKKHKPYGLLDKILKKLEYHNKTKKYNQYFKHADYLSIISHLYTEKDISKILKVFKNEPSRFLFDWIPLLTKYVNDETIICFIESWNKSDSYNKKIIDFALRSTFWINKDDEINWNKWWEENSYKWKNIKENNKNDIIKLLNKNKLIDSKLITLDERVRLLMKIIEYHKNKDKKDKSNADFSIIKYPIIWSMFIEIDNDVISKNLYFEEDNARNYHATPYYYRDTLFEDFNLKRFVYSSKLPIKLKDYLENVKKIYTQ